MKYYLDLDGVKALDAKYLELFAKESDLGSAAYVDTSVFDEAGAALQAKEEANDYTDEKVGSIPTGSATVIDYVNSTKEEIMDSFVPITDAEIESLFV